MNNAEFLKRVKELKEPGMSESEIARRLGLSTTDFRGRLLEAKAQEYNALKDAIKEMKRKTSYSNKEIAEMFDVEESRIRNIVKE